jgi:hypothetical protein
MPRRFITRADGGHINPNWLLSAFSNEGFLASAAIEQTPEAER